jgi:hypothetical protein
MLISSRGARFNRAASNEGSKRSAPPRRFRTSLGLKDKKSDAFGLKTSFWRSESIRYAARPLCHSVPFCVILCHFVTFLIILRHPASESWQPFAVSASAGLQSQAASHG